MPNQQPASCRSANGIPHPRGFLNQGGVFAPAASGAPLLAAPTAPASPIKTPETLVSILFESLTPAQKKVVCFDWNHMAGKHGLLRTRVENNWKITKPSIKSSFDTAEQQHLIRGIFLKV